MMVYCGILSCKKSCKHACTQAHLCTSKPVQQVIKLRETAFKVITIIDDIQILSKLNSLS